MNVAYAAPEIATPADLVIGLDDSSGAQAALSWAAACARASGDRLRVVHVFKPTAGAPTVWTNGFPPMPFVRWTADRDTTAHRLEKVYDAIRPELEWTLTFSEGPVAAELIWFAAAARLLVVGTRETRGRARIVGRSVSHYCLAHATCPVAAIPSRGGPDRTAPAERVPGSDQHQEPGLSGSRGPAVGRRPRPR
jgi:nucleotide-binding universal stress UspA family protein